MRAMMSQVLLFVFIGGLLFFYHVEVRAQDIIDEIRNQALQSVGPDRLGAGYAAMINFSVNPDISTATYYINDNDVDNPTLSVYRLPLRYVFKMEGHSWRPLVQANFTYQKVDAGFDVIDDEYIDSKWQTYGGTLTVGAEVPVSRDLTLIPAINAGLVHIENDADYNGELANEFLKPAFDGVIFNWDADAWLAGVSLGVDYRHAFHNFDLKVHGSLTHNYIETYDSSSSFIEFNSQVTTLDFNVDTVIPTRMSIASFPLAVVVTIGNTTFLGSDRDASGFEYFFEGGLSLEADVSQRKWVLQKLRLGAKAIYGEDVTGWGLIFGYRF